MKALQWQKGGGAAAAASEVRIKHRRIRAAYNLLFS